MTVRELELKLRELGVPPKMYSLDGGRHFEKRVFEKRFWWYEVYCMDLGIKHHTHKFKTEDEACEFLCKELINDCLYSHIPLNGIKPLKRKEPIKAPKWVYEEMAHRAYYDEVNVTYTRDIHSITFPNGYKFESEHFFADRFYKGNAIICLKSSNAEFAENHIDIPENVFMINDSGECVWTFKREFIFLDRNICVNGIELYYEEDMLYVSVHINKRYGYQYILEPSTGKLLKRTRCRFI